MTLTGRRWLDLALLCAITFGMVALSPRLRVYYSVTVIEVSMVRIAVDGTRQTVGTPPELAQIEEGYTSRTRILAVLDRAADRQMVRFTQQRNDPAGTRYELTFRYGFNSIDLTETHVAVREVSSERP